MDEVIKATKERMQIAAEALDFELAAQLKANNDLLQDYQSKSVVVSPVIRDVDVASVVSDDAFAYVNFMRARVNGAIIQSHSLEFKKKLDEDKEDLLLTAVAEMRSVFQSSAKEILVNIEVGAEWEHADFHQPQRGDKKACDRFLPQEPALLHAGSTEGPR